MKICVHTEVVSAKDDGELELGKIIDISFVREDHWFGHHADGTAHWPGDFEQIVRSVPKSELANMTVNHEGGILGLPPPDDDMLDVP